MVTRLLPIRYITNPFSKEITSQLLGSDKPIAWWRASVVGGKSLKSVDFTQPLFIIFLSL